MQNKLFLILEKIKTLFVSYPLVLLMSIAMASTIIYAIETDPKEETGFILLKLGIIFSLGISMMFALKMVSQRIGKEILWSLLGILFLVGFYFILPKKEDDFTEVHAFIIVPTFILSHLLVAFVAFINKKNTENNFWQYNKNLFVNLFLTAIFTGVLTGGVVLAILVVENLFNFDFDEKIYIETFFALAIFGNTFIFLLFSENGLINLEKNGTYPIVLKFFTQFILIPLLLIYVIILYIYSIKILINWQLPRGWVSYLVLAYALIGILALLLVYPLKDETAKSWVKIFNKIFYLSLIPLVFLLFIAIFTRLLEYGFTEARYFVLLLAFWLSAVVLYFVSIKNSSIKFIPISLFLFGLFALIFPYFNTFSVAERSQKTELKKILTENNLLLNGKIDFNKKITDTIAEEVSNKFEFLNQRVEKEYILQFLDEKSKEKIEKNKFWYLKNFFQNIEKTKKNENNYLYLENETNLQEIGDYQYAIDLQEMHKKIKINNDFIQLENSSVGKNLSYKLILNEKETFDLLPLINKIFNQYKNQSGTIRVENLSIESDLGEYHFKINFTRMSKNMDYLDTDGLILIKEK